MAMKRYKVKFSVDYEIDVEIDPEIWNDEVKAHFERYFHELENGDESIAEDLAVHHARFGIMEPHIEGYGYIARDGKLFNAPSEIKKPQIGLNIIPIQDDFEPYGISVEEVIENDEP